MKQHISYEQITELGMAIPEIMQKFNFKFISPTSIHDTIVSGLATQMTIGKMIEILETKFEYLSIQKNTFNPEGTFWQVEANPDFSFEEYELCDALWEAIKEIL